MKKEKYYRQTFDYWMDWMTKPEDQRSPMELIGCYATIFSMFEFRMRCLVFEDAWTNDYTLLKKDLLQKGRLSYGDYRTITPKEYKEYKEGSSDIFGMGTTALFMHGLKTFSILSNADFNKIYKVIELRNTILHRTMFRHKDLKDEHIQDVIKGFRILDARLKSLRRSWKRMKKIKKEI